MRRLIIISLFALVYSLASGQAANQVFDNDTTKGAETVTFTGAKASHIYQGVAGFTFTTAHDTATFYLQGCYNTNAWYDIDTLGVSGASAVNRELYQTPPRFKYYRLTSIGNATDTCYISNVRNYLKY